MDERHVADLRASGLSDETIKASGCYSASPAEVERILGFNIDSGGLIFPYPDGFKRVKADTPPQLEGKPAKYLSPKKAANRLYVPPNLDAGLLKDPETTLVITEGEKKALKAVQEGVCCVGLAGVWAWRTWSTWSEGGLRQISRHLPELEQIAWRNREVLICFDSDLIRKPQVARAERELARLLTSRGAKVYGLRLLGDRGEKCGLDDWLLGNPAEKLYDLPRVNYSRGRILTAAQLLEMDFAEAPDVIGEGILPEGGGLILAGESGVGKSLIALEWGVRLAHGLSVLGLPVPRRRRVHYQGQENAMKSVQSRLRRMLHGLSLNDAPGLTLGDPALGFDLGSRSDQKQLKDHLAQAEPEVVILDPLSSFLGAVNENDNLIIRSRLDALTRIGQELGCAFIIIDHYGKPSEHRDDAHRTRGASSKKDWCHTMMGLTVKGHEPKTFREITFHKVRDGRWPRPSILLQRDMNFVHHVVGKDILIPADKVAEVLADIGGRAKSQRALATEVLKAVTAQGRECSESTARRAVERALEHELIKPDGKAVVLAE